MLVALLSLATAVADVDQSDDAAIVSAFLAAVELSDDGKAASHLAPDVLVGNATGTQRTSLDDFFAYARECRLSAIRLVAGDRRLPVGVSWTCRMPGTDRNASFWLKGSRISRIAWGPQPVISIPPASPAPVR